MNNRNKQYGRVTIGAADSAIARHASPTPASRKECEAHALRAVAANGFGAASIGQTEPSRLLNGIELQQQARAHRPRWQSQFLNKLMRVTARYVRGMRVRWERRRRIRATFLALQCLDASTLRDLGFHRSEILSVATEIGGDCCWSRVRAAARVGH